MRARAPARLLIAASLAASTPALADERDDAKRHFVVGLAAAEAGDYATAVAEFQAANRLYPHPHTLYNIGRAYEDMGEAQKALDAYRLYLTAVPEQSELVQPRIDRLVEALRPAPIDHDAEDLLGGVASTDELERLQAIAEELQRLGAALADRAAGSATRPRHRPPHDPQPPPAAPPPLLSGAYEREVVTASRYGQPPLDSPSTVTILTAQDIRMSGATNLPDVLRRVAGVDVMFLSGGQADISIRGFNREMSNKVLVLMDGREMYLEHLGAPIWGGFPIALEEIERVEVIRGPGSAVYGANAVMGVINIITRTPGEGDNLVHLAGGSAGYGRATAVLTGQSGPAKYRASAGYDRAGRWSARRRPHPPRTACDGLPAAPPPM